jgi:peptide/nickel transport system permease protein
VLGHLWVPVIVIGAAGTAGMIRRLRANLLDELQKQYVVTGRAKGMSARRLLLKYPLRMALNPFVSDIGNLLPHVISGAAIVSIVLSLPTTGPMLLEALRSQDMYLAGSFLMFLATLTVVGVLVSDLLLALLDPRIRLHGGTTR